VLVAVLFFNMPPESIIADRLTEVFSLAAEMYILLTELVLK